MEGWSDGSWTLRCPPGRYCTPAYCTPTGGFPAPCRHSGVVAADRLDPHAVARHPHLDAAELAAVRRRAGLVGQQVARAQLVLDCRVDAVELGRRVDEEAAPAGLLRQLREVAANLQVQPREI